MRGYWASLLLFFLAYGVHNGRWCSVLSRTGYGRQRDSGICWVSRSRSGYCMHAAVALMRLVQVLHGCDYIQNYMSLWPLLNHESYLAFEFTKRKFTKTYGAQLPVWALLTSGATGGVSSTFNTEILALTHLHIPGRSDLLFLLVLDRILALLLPTRYPSTLLPPAECYAEPSWRVATDVVKSRIQLRAAPPSGTPVQYIAHEIRTIVAEAGVSGLFRGLTPSCMSYFPPLCCCSSYIAFGICCE